MLVSGRVGVHKGLFVFKLPKRFPKSIETERLSPIGGSSGEAAATSAASALHDGGRERGQFDFLEVSFAFLRFHDFNDIKRKWISKLPENEQ